MRKECGSLLNYRRLLRAGLGRLDCNQEESNNAKTHRNVNPFNYAVIRYTTRESLLKFKRCSYFKKCWKISSRIGKLVRIHVPISYESWDKVPSKYKDGIWDELLASSNPTKEITRGQVWEKTHTKKDGTISDMASVYFDKIAKIKESINDNDEKDLPLDEDIISQVFGKDKKGRTQSIGANISRSRTQVKASTIARKQPKRAHGDSENLNARLKNMEGTLKSLVDMFKGYTSQGNRIPDIASNEGGSGTPRESVGRVMNNDIANPLNLSRSSNQKCEILNFELEVITTTTVRRDSTTCIIHGNMYLRQMRNWLWTIYCYQKRR